MIDLDLLMPHDTVVVMDNNKEGTVVKQAEDVPRSYQIKTENKNIIRRNCRSLLKLPTPPELN